MNFSERIKELRQRHRLTQAKFAKIFDIGLATVAMWETAKRNPPAEMLLKIAKHFNITIDYLLGNDNDSLANKNLLSYPIIKGVSINSDGSFQNIESGLYQEIPRRIIGEYNPNLLLAFLICDDSMYPKFLKNDVVLVKIGKDVDNDNIILLAYDECKNGAIRKIYSEQLNEYLDLIPLNPKFQLHRLSGNSLKSAQVIGKVIYLFRKLD